MVNISIKRLNGKVAVGITATGTAHSVYKHLVKAILHTRIFGSRRIVVVCNHNLISTRKNKVVIIVTETPCNLSPHYFQPVVSIIFLRICGL